MEYDPVKLRLTKYLGRNHQLRKLFFILLDLLFLRTWYVHRELKKLAGRFHNRVSILDAGMGFGQYSDKMLELFNVGRLTGLEIDSAHLYGSEHYFRKVSESTSITLGDVQILPLMDNSFDLILSVDVMEHVEDDQATFGEFHRVLKPGGVFVMHTPRIQSDAPEEAEDHDHWEVGEHVRDGYRDSEATERLRKAGFDKVELVHGYGFPGQIAWTLLQRVPMTLLGRFKTVMLIPTFLYLLCISPIALLMMWWDLSFLDHPQGGSLMVIAERAKEE